VRKLADKMAGWKAEHWVVWLVDWKDVLLVVQKELLRADMMVVAKAG
jgi:hypothetical protein